MWGIPRFPTLAGFFAAATALGFDRFELNHAVDSPLLDAVDLNDICITSVHEPCPSDVSTAALKRSKWFISSLDEDRRRHGVHAVKRSIELAARLGVKAVIVHPGEVEGLENLDNTQRHLFRQGQVGQPEYEAVRVRLIQERAARAPEHMRSVRRSLLELAEYAWLLGVRLGLENRYHYYSIPQLDELEELLTMGLGDTVAYWHDVGHAQVLQDLGFAQHEEWLRRFSSRIVGVHLHDLVGILDHQAAGRGRYCTPPGGRGTMDWGLVARYIPAAALRTCEFQPDNTPAQVAAGLRVLVDQGIVSADLPEPASASRAG